MVSKSETRARPAVPTCLGVAVTGLVSRNKQSLWSAPLGRLRHATSATGFSGLSQAALERELHEFVLREREPFGRRYSMRSRPSRVK